MEESVDKTDEISVDDVVEELSDTVSMDNDSRSFGSEKSRRRSSDSFIHEDPSLDKVFVLSEVIEETKPKIESPLEIVPKTKLPDKKIISSIEKKLKLICDDVASEKSNEQNKTDSEQPKIDICETNTKSNENDVCEKTDDVAKSGPTSPVVLETNDDHSESVEALHELTEAEQKKNPFLEKLVASCKEKLGVDGSMVSQQMFCVFLAQSNMFQSSKTG
jgi:hypothetical protein